MRLGGYAGTQFSSSTHFRRRFSNHAAEGPHSFGSMQLLKRQAVAITGMTEASAASYCPAAALRCKLNSPPGPDRLSTGTRLCHGHFESLVECSKPAVDRDIPSADPRQAHHIMSAILQKSQCSTYLV
jgi:hypothetical protein